VNRYGAEALEHWRAYLSASYGRLEDPEEFFTELSEQADAEIEDRYLEYAGPDVLGESADVSSQPTCWFPTQARRKFRFLIWRVGGG
jgi:hypothetical protein